jgi:hypothetical protein
MRGVSNDTVATYFRGAMMVAALAVRWCTQATLGISDGSCASATTSTPGASLRARARRLDQGEAQFSG